MTINGNTLFYRMMLETREFVSGTKITKREFREIRKVSADMAGEMGTVGLQFDKFARLARGGGDAAKTVSLAFGKLAVSSKKATEAGRQYITQLRMEVQELKAREAAGEKLNAAEKTRLATNEQIANRFLASSRKMRSARAAELLEIRKKLHVERAARHEKERQATLDAKLANGERFYAMAIRATSREKMKQAIIDRKRKRDSTRAYHELIRNEIAYKRGVQQSTVVAGGMARQLGGILKQIAIVTAGYKSLRFAIDSVRLALEVERSQKQFEIFTGSRGTSERIMQGLRQTAATTPLTLSVSTQSTRTLLQYGIAAKDVIKRLRQLGDISGADTERLQRLSLAFGQISAAGRLQGQELRQLIESGWNPLATISRKTGESMFDLKIRMADGAVSAREITEALDMATTEGGRFADALERVASETTLGKLQILRGEIEQLQIEAGKTGTALLGPFAEYLTPIIAANRLAAQAAQEKKPGGLFGRAMRTAFGGTAGITEKLFFGDKTDLQIRRETLQTDAASLVSEMKNEQQLLSISQEELNVQKLTAELRKEGLNEEADRIEMRKEQLDLARKEAADQKARDAIIGRHESTSSQTHRQMQELQRLKSIGMFDNAPGVFKQEAQRLTREFIEGQVDKVVDTQKEAATATTRGSREEFEMMRRIAMQDNQAEGKKADARHKAEMTVFSLIHSALGLLPSEIADLMPTPVDG